MKQYILPSSHTQLAVYLYEFETISATATQAIAEITSVLNIKKNQDFQSIGHTCKTIYFINKGLARIYYYRDGVDITESFVFENNIIARVESLFTGKPSRKAIKRFLSGRSLCSVRLFQSVVPSSIPQPRQLRQKRPLKNKKHIFGVVSFLIFTRSLSAFVGATASATPHHFATLRKLRTATFCHVHVCRPLCFQRLLLRTAIGVGTAPTTFNPSLPFFQLSIVNYQLIRRFALNQGSPTAALYFFPAVSRSQSFSPLRELRFVPVLRWLSDCRNTATSLLTKNSVKTPFFAAVLGGVYLPSTTILKNPPPIIKRHPQLKSAQSVPSVAKKYFINLAQRIAKQIFLFVNSWQEIKTKKIKKVS